MHMYIYTYIGNNNGEWLRQRKEYLFTHKANNTLEK